LLLAAQMAFKKLVASNVTGVHTRNGMVHEQLGVKLGDTGSRRDGSKGLPKLIAPL
jgi:hypothetical protein